jgi:Fe(3+) dicitrate transport protein
MHLNPIQFVAGLMVTLKAEFGRSKDLYHIPDPLNDSMFNADPRASTRSDNYFSPDVYIP